MHCCLVSLVLSVALGACTPVSKDVFLRIPKSSVSKDEVFLKDSNSNCPKQPRPVDLPSPLPDQIQSALTKLDNFVNNETNVNRVPGVVIGISYRGKTLWAKGYGIISKDKPTITPNVDTIFRIGSVSKIFPVIMLYQMYAKGYVQSLDDPLRKYAPDFKINSINANNEITLRQMASQFSGLPREGPCGNVTKDLNICPLTTDEILEKLSSQYVLFPPWIKPSYSNLAYALLGRLLVGYYNKSTTYEDYIENNILKPLQLSDTGFVFDDSIRARMAVGYGPNGDPSPLYNWGYISPAAQMYSTINDLNKLSQFFYEADSFENKQLVPLADNVLSSELRREMSLSYYVNPDYKTGFGTPWEIMYKGNYTIRTKGGNVDGYSALFGFIPELNLGINALFSSAFDEFTFAEQVYDILLPPLVSYLAENQPKPSFPPNPEAYIGMYNASGLTANIFANNNFLYLKTDRGTVYLSYQQVDLMQIYFPRDLLPCIIVELQASEGQWVYFDAVDSTGKSPGFSIPGVVSSLHWKRID